MKVYANGKMKKCKDCVNYNLYWFGNYICRKRGVVIGKESISCNAFEPNKLINSWKTGEEKKKPINDKYGYLVCPWCKKNVGCGHGMEFQK